MTKLHRLYDEHGQSPWLDHLTRDHLRNGHLEKLVSSGGDGFVSLEVAPALAHEDHGIVARTIDESADGAAAILTRAADIGVDLTDVGSTLEDQGVAAFTRSFAEVLASLQAKVVAYA